MYITNVLYLSHLCINNTWSVLRLLVRPAAFCACQMWLRLISLAQCLSFTHTHVRNVPPWSRCSVFNISPEILAKWDILLPHTSPQPDAQEKHSSNKKRSRGESGDVTTHTHTQWLTATSYYGKPYVCGAPKKLGMDIERWSKSPVCVCVCLSVFIFVSAVTEYCLGLVITVLTTLSGHTVPTLLKSGFGSLAVQIRRWGVAKAASMTHNFKVIVEWESIKGLYYHSSMQERECIILWKDGWVITSTVG